MITSHELNEFYAQLLNPELFSDYAPNGLQIEGSKSIQKIAFAVSATQESITQAADLEADALVVHHGLFWHFHGVRTITGTFAKRILPLVKNEMNLFAYHLPLDGHSEIGNAAVLGSLISCIQQQPFGDYKGASTGIKGIFKTPITVSALAKTLENVLNHSVIVASPDKSQLIKSLGIITGGANNEWQQAVKEGLDAYITGEISEHNWHDAKEAGVHFFAGGHHATEQFGIKALMEKTQQQFNIECVYLDSDNPA